MILLAACLVSSFVSYFRDHFPQCSYVSWNTMSHDYFKFCLCGWILWCSSLKECGLAGNITAFHCWGRDLLVAVSTYLFLSSSTATGLTWRAMGIGNHASVWAAPQFSHVISFPPLVSLICFYCWNICCFHLKKKRKREITVPLHCVVLSNNQTICWSKWWPVVTALIQYVPVYPHSFTALKASSAGI